MSFRPEDLMQLSYIIEQNPVWCERFVNTIDTDLFGTPSVSGAEAEPSGHVEAMLPTHSVSASDAVRNS